MNERLRFEAWCSYANVNPERKGLWDAWLARAALDDVWKTALLNKLDTTGLQVPPYATPMQILDRVISWHTQQERDFGVAAYLRDKSLSAALNRAEIDRVTKPLRRRGLFPSIAESGRKAMRKMFGATGKQDGEHS